MSIALVQHASGYTAGVSHDQAYDSPNTAGNLLICTTRAFSGIAIASIADTQGNNWQLAVSSLIVGDTTTTWYVENCKGGPNTVTVTYASSTFPVVIVAEYSGLVTSGSLDQTNHHDNDTDVVYTSDPVTTLFADELLIGQVTKGDHTDVTPDVGWSIVDNVPTNPDAGALNALILLDRIVSATGTYANTGAFTGSEQYAASIATFIGAAAGHSISGNAGVASALVSWSGTASGSTTAAGDGSYTIPSLADGPYTITPSLAGYTFVPASRSVTVSGADITGVNFTAVSPGSAYSVPDCRDTSIWPNHSVNVQGTLQYTVPAHPSRTPPVDSRAAGAPVDSRKSPNIPLNSRTHPPFES